MPEYTIVVLDIMVGSGSKKRPVILANMGYTDVY